jgi:adenosine deaminase
VSSDTSLSKELSLLTEAFDYDLDDLLTFQLNAAEAAFLPLEDRDELGDTITRGFEAI